MSDAGLASTSLPNAVFATVALLSATPAKSENSGSISASMSLFDSSAHFLETGWDPHNNPLKRVDRINVSLVMDVI